MQSGLRVLVAVPCEIERAGLCLFVADAGFEVVAEASDGHGAVELAEECDPDVAVVDSSMPDLPALGLVHFLTRKCPGLQVLLYTDRCSRDWMDVALREGVRAFVLKTRVHKHLAPALRALADHRPYCEEAVDDVLLDDLLESGPHPATMELTSREWQVLQMAVEERSTKEMAQALGVSPKTIESFRTQVRRKLGFRTRADLIRYSLSRTK